MALRCPLGDLSPNGTEMAANPALSYPPDILTFDPKWAGCGINAVHWAFDDPPSALSPVSVLVTVSTDRGTTPTSPSLATPVVQQTTTDPSPGGTATFHSVAETRGTFSNPDSSSHPDPPSHPDSPSNGDPPPSALLDDPAKGQITTKPTRTEAHAFKDPTMGPPRSSLLVATVGSQQVYALPDGGLSVQGMTIGIGDPAITIDGTSISADSRSIYIGASAYDISSLVGTFGLPPPILNGKHIEAATAGAVLFGGQIISDGQAMTVDGYRISNGHGRMVIDGTTFQKPLYGTHVPTAGPTPLPSVIDGKSLQLDEDGALVLDGKSMFSGQQTTIDGKRLFMKASEVVIDSTTYALPVLPHPAAAEPSSRLTQIDDEEVMFDPDGRVVLEGSTMNAGEQTTVQGTYISVGQGRVVMGGHTYSALLASNTLGEPGVAQSSIRDDKEASMSNPASAVPGGTIGQADNSPTTSASAQLGLGAMIMSGLKDMSLQTTEASPAAESGGPSALTNLSGTTSSQSSDSGSTGFIPLWVALAATTFVMLLQLLR
ncbi:MAG: hypothetical protein Q9225_005708 [Loekoesia sp. 1 TL-2023]